MTQDTPSENPTPDWLVETQNRSWEPEILISGLTLTSLFIFPVPLFNFFARLVQESGLDFIVTHVLFIYLTLVISTLKVSFIIHLVLRFIWTALVGLSYVFPHGVVREKLMSRQQAFEYPRPERMVIQLEKACSLVFSIPMAFSLVMLAMTLFLFTLAFIALQFDLGKEAFFVGALVVASFTIILSYLLKKSKMAKSGIA